MDELRHKAEAYCAAAEHCPFEVKEKLYQWGAEEKQIASILDHLQEANYTNAERYCAAFTNDKIKYQGWGRIKVKMMLQYKRLPEDAIQKALSSFDEIEYKRILTKVASKKKGATWEQVARFLIQRGFEYDLIREIIKP